MLPVADWREVAEREGWRTFSGSVQVRLGVGDEHQLRLSEVDRY